MIEELIIQRLEAQREKKKIGIGVFADKYLHTDKKNYYNWRHNKQCNLSHEELYNLSEELGCSIDYLYGIDEYENRQISDVHAVTGLSDKAIKALKDERFQDMMVLFINKFVEHPAFEKFAVAFGKALISADTITKDNKNEIVVTLAGTVTNRTMMDLVHTDCDDVSRCFTEYVRDFFDYWIDKNSRVEVTTLETTKEGESNEKR